MHGIRFFWLLVLATLMGGCVERTPASDRAESSATTYSLTAADLARLETRAIGGDCDAALRISRHFSFGRNDQLQAIPWLRKAASCGDAAIKAELVYLLLGSYTFAAVEQEVDLLASEIARINPELGATVRSEVSQRRRASTSR